MAKTKKELRDDEQPRPEEPKNVVRKVKPAPETTEKALAVRKAIAAKEQQAKGIDEIRAYVTKHQDKRAKFVSLLKKKRTHKTPKAMMTFLEDTFLHAGQHPPVFFSKMDQPFVAFLLSIDEKIAEWPPEVLKAFLDELCTKSPTDVPGMIGDAKRVVSEIFDDIGHSISVPYLTRWKQWPYINDKKVEQPADKENLMASKMATKKKVQSEKRDGATEAAAKPDKKGKAAAKEKPAKTGGGGRRSLGDESTLKPGKNMPSKGIYGQLLPLIPKTGITLAALCKAAATKIKFPASKVRRYAAGAVREGYATAE